MDNLKLMERAVELALMAEKEGNLPVGSAITLGGEIIAEGRSALWVSKFDATRHAEMEEIRAVPRDLWIRAGEMSLYTTLEPCLICLGGILLHGIGEVVMGSTDSYGGFVTSQSNLPPFFLERFENTQWVGPTMDDVCDPLHERLLELEGARKKMRMG